MGSGGFVHITTAIEFSIDMVNRLRSALVETFGERPYAIVAGGSYARQEASTESDLDFFLISDKGQSESAALEDMPKILELVRSLVPKAAAAGGAFEQHECIESMVQNVGGQRDLNDKFTRRILFLLEGEWLLGEQLFKAYRRRVLDKYVRDTITDHQLALFFLNDLIRYYRTVCVDFEFKTVEDGKPWGDRNIKLMFSRKLLYFSGLIVAAETCQRTYKQKMEIMEELLSLTPIKRLEHVCGHELEPALKLYDGFLKSFSDPKTREVIREVKDESKNQVEEFRRLKNAGHHFSMELSRLIKEIYDSTHPIHRALIL